MKRELSRTEPFEFMCWQLVDIKKLHEATCSVKEYTVYVMLRFVTDAFQDPLLDNRLCMFEAVPGFVRDPLLFLQCK
jgi:hypothetical protein